MAGKLNPVTLRGRLDRNGRTQVQKRAFSFRYTELNRQFIVPQSFVSSKSKPTKFKILSAVSTQQQQQADPFEAEAEVGEQFDWYSEWYAVAPVFDLDKRVPHGKRVMGLDLVVWWDRNESGWKVFDDCCPHRLAPLSEGRIDEWGRLQCVYHGWCFTASGRCQFIPQAPPHAPPVHTSEKHVWLLTHAQSKMTSSGFGQTVILIIKTLSQIKNLLTLQKSMIHHIPSPWE